ncbi:MAG: tyrosine-protein phosphatase [Burkholderiales bacterium]|nr:tyrosine-protein phosphatase [Burkholderiales bacterium]
MDQDLPRVVPLRGATNFRDLGGYEGHGGRRLRWRRLFRSDQLGDLTPADHEVLAGLGIAASFDFRGVDERAAAPYEVPGLAQHSLAIEPTVAQHMQAITGAGRTLTVPVVEGLMRDLYRGLVNEGAARFAELFGHLLRAEAPVVFHCTAGKDRTGVAAALVLLALGVPREAVMRDYLLTNEVFRPPWTPRADMHPEVLQALWGVQAGYLEAAFEAIDEGFGGPGHYLRRQVGLGERQLEALAQRYLQPG